MNPRSAAMANGATLLHLPVTSSTSRRQRVRVNLGSSLVRAPVMFVSLRSRKSMHEQEPCTQLLYIIMHCPHDPHNFAVGDLQLHVVTPTIVILLRSGLSAEGTVGVSRQPFHV